MKIKRIFYCCEAFSTSSLQKIFWRDTKNISVPEIISLPPLAQEDDCKASCQLPFTQSENILYTGTSRPTRAGMSVTTKSYTTKLFSLCLSRKWEQLDELTSSKTGKLWPLLPAFCSNFYLQSKTVLLKYDIREFIMSKVICDIFSLFGEFEQLLLLIWGNRAFSWFEFVLFKNGLNKSLKTLQVLCPWKVVDYGWMWTLLNLSFCIMRNYLQIWTFETVNRKFLAFVSLLTKYFMKTYHTKIWNH